MKTGVWGPVVRNGHALKILVFIICSAKYI